MTIYSFWLKKKPSYSLEKAQAVLFEEKKEYRVQIEPFANAFCFLLSGALEKRKTYTAFTLPQKPSIPLSSYVGRFFEYATTEINIYIVALIYLDRYLAYSNLELNAFNVHKLLICSLHEAYYQFCNKGQLLSNNSFAKTGGITLEELNALKLEYNRSLHLDFSIDVKTLRQYAAIFGDWHTLESLFSLYTFGNNEHRQLAEVLANYLSKTAKKSMEIKEAKKEIDIFSTAKLPTTPILNYLLYFIKHVTKEESMPLMVIMLIYIDRYLEYSCQFLTPYNMHRLSTFSLIAAHKFFSENLLSSYSQIAVLPSKEFSSLEMSFYKKLDFRLSVEEETFEFYSNTVKTLFSEPKYSAEEIDDDYSNQMVI